MNKEQDECLTILVVDDIEETRDGIEKLLKVDGYAVDGARHEREAVESACRNRPDLILVSLGGGTQEVIARARGIRERAGLDESVAVVVFCVADVEEGEEVEIGENVYVTRPDNFNQLREMLARLLKWRAIAEEVSR
jgi:CheY-like chemotaxis protein